MRLSERELRAIQDYFSRMADDVEVILFGSRINALKRGGDLDLLLVVKDESKKRQLRSQKSLFVYDLQGLLGEQRIDLTIATKSELDSDPFLKTLSGIDITRVGPLEDS